MMVLVHQVKSYALQSLWLILCEKGTYRCGPALGVYGLFVDIS